MAKKLILTALALAMGAAAAGAKEFEKNALLFNAGLGFGLSTPELYLESYNAHFKKTEKKPLKSYNGAVVLGGAASFDWMVFAKHRITLGFETGFNYTGYSEPADGSLCSIPLLFRAAWHPRFIKAENFDAFLVVKGGPAVLLPSGDLKPLVESYADLTVTGAFGVNLGAAYYVTPSFGIYAELGFDMAAARYKREGTNTADGGYSLRFDPYKFATVGVTFKTGGKKSAE